MSVMELPPATINLLSSLSLGDVVTTNTHIGALRYLGPLNGDTRFPCPIHQTYAGVELADPS